MAVGAKVGSRELGDGDGDEMAVTVTQPPNTPPPSEEKKVFYLLQHFLRDQSKLAEAKVSLLAFPNTSALS